ncbi:MAG TPA: lysylphosphatidylglycerol synthase domain-containing protein [Clostridiaceae bacterium]|nr:lysylphosphatidylglycerol synthase domain-containing protein [Clostridiaceae bacterium]
MGFLRKKLKELGSGDQAVGWLKRIPLLLIVLLMFMEGSHVLDEIQFGEAVSLLKHTPDTTLLLYMAAGFTAVSVTTFYDFAWFHFNPRTIGKMDIFRTAWTASAINSLAGLGGMGGAMVRTMFYRKENLEKEDLLRINVLLLPSYFTGLGVMMWLSLLGTGYSGSILPGSPALFGVRILFRAYLLLFLLSAFIPIPFVQDKLEKWGFVGSLKIKMGMVAVSTLGWMSAAVFLWIIGHQIDPGLSLVGSLLSFTVAMSVGMVSPMPAGLGVFDVIMVLGLQDSGLNATQSLGAVMMFRIFYYVVPFIAASAFIFYRLITAGILRIRPRVQRSWMFALQKGRMLMWRKLEVLRKMPDFLKWFMMVMASTLLVLSAATPFLPQRMHILEPLLRMLQRLSLSPQRAMYRRK